MTEITWTNETRKLSDLIPWERNPRTITHGQATRLIESVESFGQVELLAIGPKNELYNGHQRLQVLIQEHGDMVVDVRVASRPLSEKEREKLTVYLHKGAAGDWDFDMLADEFNADDLMEWGFEAFELGIEYEEPEPLEDNIARASLAERFVVPPFSVLDARQGYWQERKRAWLALGIESELGRGMVNAAPGNGKGRKIKGKTPAVIGGSQMPLDRQIKGKSPAQKSGQDLMRSVKGEDFSSLGGNQSGTSIFDPVLCELAYTWFAPPDGHILDPFAGGSVRGIVAAKLGRKYTGIDLRAEQVEANEHQAIEIVPDNKPAWITGDSLTAIPDVEFDFIFSCPPYYDLEIYSEEDGDLSNLDSYDEFISTYNEIVAQSVARLKNDRFACFVVGDIRGKEGNYRNFVSDTISAFIRAGTSLYNEAILVTAVGSLPIRVGRQFEGGRKLGKTHQNVLVFVKGDGKKATQDCGNVSVVDIWDELTGKTSELIEA